MDLQNKKMKKNFSYISIIIGIIIIGIMSSVVYRSVTFSSAQTVLKTKTFHATVMAESEIDKEISKTTHIDGITEEMITIGNSEFTVVKDITILNANLKRITVKVFFEHMEKPYSIEFFTSVKE